MHDLANADAELATGKLRIAQLEREAIERSGDAATALRAQLDRYQTLVLAMAQVVWTGDSKGEMVGEQPSWTAYTGQTPEQYQGGGWLDAVHPDDRARTRALWERAVAARAPCEYEHRLRRHDGDYRYFSVRSVPVFADDGSIREWAGIKTDITQRKLTEQSLRDGVRQLGELADAMPQIVWGAGPDGHFDYYNRRWYEFTGRPEGPAGDTSWADVVHPDDQKNSLERWHSALASGDAYEIEYRLRRKAGDYRWYLTRALPVRDSAGTITRWLGTCTDIDERKRTEDRYQTLVLAIAQIIWTSDPQGQMIGEQPSWAAYTGQTPEQYQGRAWLDAVHPDDRVYSQAVWQRAVAARAPCEYEHRLRRHDGEYRYFSVRRVPVFADDRSIREWAGINTDITQRKLTEQSLRDGVRQFRELADAMPQIVWGARPDGLFDYYNRRWYDFTGRPDGSGGDASWADVVHPDDQADSLERWRSAVESGDAYEIEYRLKRRDGEYRWYLTRAVPVRDQSNAITRWLGTCTDIDERRRTEDQLHGYATQLVQSNRELEDFAAIASHDLQEPLRKIRSFVGYLRDEQAANLNVEGRDYLNRIQNAATRMAALVSDLLEFSRISSKGRAFVPVDLNEVARDVVVDLEARLAETHGRVEISELPTVASDSIQMRQLLQNLIGNALKFHRTDVAPIVRVSAEILDTVGANGRIQPAASCRISVADNGIGFDEKYLDRVFTIFQRLHGRGVYEGTGIGLAICRKIVERHGGSITARSHVGEGTTFVVTLPLQQKNGGGNGK